MLGCVSRRRPACVAAPPAIITAVELGMLRLGDAPLLAAGARDTVRVTAWRGCYLRSSS